MARAKERVSLRALAARLRVTHPAVRKGIKSGRLRKSIGHDASGRPFVRDVALAKREWAAGAAQPANDGRGGGRKRAQRAARNAAPPPGPPPATSSPAAAVESGAPRNDTLVQAQLRLVDQRTAGMELANKRKRGELHDVADCDRRQFEIARLVRARVENVADRIADLGPAIRARIRDELRQALSILADDLGE